VDVICNPKEASGSNFRRKGKPTYFTQDGWDCQPERPHLKAGVKLSFLIFSGKLPAADLGLSHLTTDAQSSHRTFFPLTVNLSANWCHFGGEMLLFDLETILGISPVVTTIHL